MMQSPASMIRRAAGLASLLSLCAGPAAAQVVGVRAQGMAGAFTGVADDASAVYWNPAGLAAGAYFSAVVDFNSLKTASDSPVSQDSSGTLSAFATPPLGLSYYRTRLDRVAVAAPTEAPATLILHHVGATLVQSIWGGLAAGATVQVVRGVADRTASTRFNMDVGLMESGSIGRIGLTVHNIFQPTFATGASLESVRLDRQVRAGGSVDLSDTTVVAADADLTKSNLTGIERRAAAVGVEHHLNAKAAIRGGVQWSTLRLREGGAVPGQPGPDLGLAPEASFGGSYAVYGRSSLDAQATVGSKNGDRGWGIGLTMIF